MDADQCQNLFRSRWLTKRDFTAVRDWFKALATKCTETIRSSNQTESKSSLLDHIFQSSFNFLIQFNYIFKIKRACICIVRLHWNINIDLLIQLFLDNIECCFMISHCEWWLLFLLWIGWTSDCNSLYYKRDGNALNTSVRHKWYVLPLVLVYANIESSLWYVSNLPFGLHCSFCASNFWKSTLPSIISNKIYIFIHK